MKYLKEHILINNDCLDALKKIEDGKIKLIITSPPYNIGKEYEAKLSIEQYLESQEEVITELVRVLAEDGSICWQSGNYIDKGEVFPLDMFYYPIFKRHGLKMRNRIIWHFGHGLHCTKRLSGRYETILWFTKSDNYLFNLDPIRVPSKYPSKKSFKGNKKGKLSCNPLGKNPSDVWEVLLNDWESLYWDIPNVKSNHPEKLDHPCQYPVELVERCVLALTNENDWILDPYAGVCSTAVAAIKNNRNAYSIERDESYCNIAAKRISDLRNETLKLRPMTQKIYEPTARDIERNNKAIKLLEISKKEIIKTKSDTHENSQDILPFKW